MKFEEKKEKERANCGAVEFCSGWEIRKVNILCLVFIQISH